MQKLLKVNLPSDQNKMRYLNVFQIDKKTSLNVLFENSNSKINKLVDVTIFCFHKPNNLISVNRVECTKDVLMCEDGPRPTDRDSRNRQCKVDRIFMWSSMPYYFRFRKPVHLTFSISKANIRVLFIHKRVVHCSP